MPDFIEVYEQDKDKRFMVVGVGIDNEEKIANFVQQLKVNYPVLVRVQTAMQVPRDYGNHSDALSYSIKSQA